jgi:hypothetical protein
MNTSSSNPGDISRPLGAFEELLWLLEDLPHFRCGVKLHLQHTNAAWLETVEQVGAVCEPRGKREGTGLNVSSAPSTEFVAAY